MWNCTFKISLHADAEKQRQEGEVRFDSTSSINVIIKNQNKQIGNTKLDTKKKKEKEEETEDKQRLDLDLNKMKSKGDKYLFVKKFIYHIN